MSIWIKICGLRTLEAIEAAHGADAVGFVFYEPSPRHVSIELAATLARAVPAHVQRVAVFHRPAPALVQAAIAAVAPHFVQMDATDLSAHRLPAGVERLPVLRGGAAPNPLPPRCLVEGQASGVAERADWRFAAELAQRVQVVLAGGLDAANVAEAIDRVRPFGVDVSSGVERTRGHKDPAAIAAFIEAARRGARVGHSKETA